MAIVWDHTKWCSDPASIRETLSIAAEEAQEIPWSEDSGERIVRITQEENYRSIAQPERPRAAVCCGKEKHRETIHESMKPQAQPTTNNNISSQLKKHSVPREAGLGSTSSAQHLYPHTRITPYPYCTHIHIHIEILDHIHIHPPVFPKSASSPLAFPPSLLASFTPPPSTPLPGEPGHSTQSPPLAANPPTPFLPPPQTSLHIHRASSPSSFPVLPSPPSSVPDFLLSPSPLSPSSYPTSPSYLPSPLPKKSFLKYYRTSYAFFVFCFLFQVYASKDWPFFAQDNRGRTLNPSFIQKSPSLSLYLSILCVFSVFKRNHTRDDRGLRDYSKNV